MEGKRIRVLTVKYNEKIQPYEVPCFRGAINAVMGKDADVLFHNHTGDATYRYSYPMVQYKGIDGNAAVVFVDDAISSADSLLFLSGSQVCLGNRAIPLSIERVIPEEQTVNIVSESCCYSIRQWQPLNADNYKRYMQTDSFVEKITILESILKGNILSLCKGIGVYMEEELKVTITSPPVSRLMKNKGVNMLIFDMDFKTNISLPDNIGLGKNASIGYGTIKKIH